MRNKSKEKLWLTELKVLLHETHTHLGEHVGLHVEKENPKEPKKSTLPWIVCDFQNFPCTL